MVGNTSTPGSAGVGPTLISKSWDSPTPMLPPVHSMVSMAWLIASPSTITGVAMGLRVMDAFQPGVERTVAETRGWSLGNWTRNPTVAPSARSFGTRRAITAVVAPGATVSGCRLTWADAGAAPATTSAATAANPTSGRVRPIRAVIFVIARSSPRGVAPETLSDRGAPGQAEPSLTATVP